MDRKLAFIGATVGAAFLSAACGSYGTSGYGSSASTPSSGQYPGVAGPSSGSSAPSTTIVSGRSSALGQILTDSSGRTLYLFEGDKGTASSCHDACSGVWPPALTNGTPAAGAGVNQSLLSTTTRKDGTSELVYNGHPLYYFISDKQAGDTAGQGLKSFGADWYVLSPSGAKVDQG